jgi:phosphoribosylformylglycinamidine synthase subunit PurS
MANIKVKVEVRLKAGVHDPQGETIKHALANLGYSGIKSITTGKVFTLDLEAESAAAAIEAAKIYADKLLANPVIEEFRVETIA